MPDSLHELLHPDAMGALVNRYADQAEENDDFIRIYEEGEEIQANVDGTFKWEELRYSRDLAPIAYQDSPSTSTKKMIATPKTGSVFVIQEHTDLPMRFLDGWRNPGSPVANARAVINNHLRNLTGKVRRTENYWAAKSMLTQTGVVDLSAIPNSQIPSGSLTYPVQAIDATAAWSSPATALRSGQINPMRKAYHQAAGFKARRAIASQAVEGYITGNTEVSNLLTDGSMAGRILARSFEEAEQSDDAVVRFGGLQWAFVEDYYALDSAKDTPVDVNSDDDVFALLPARNRSMDCFAIARGVTYVPRGQIAGEIAGAPNNLVNAVRGRGAFVELLAAGQGIRLHVFSSICLVQKWPNAVGVYDATP